MAMGFRTIIFLLALLVGVPLLQIFLSRRESKWPGLILPLLTFLYALVMALSAAAYNGGIPWGPILASLLLGNIPTVILLAIYAACREKFHKRSELEKMQIKDREKGSPALIGSRCGRQGIRTGFERGGTVMSR